MPLLFQSYFVLVWWWLEAVEISLRMCVEDSVASFVNQAVLAYLCCFLPLCFILVSLQVGFVSQATW